MYTYNVYKLLFYYFANIENYNTIFLFLKLKWCLSYYTRITKKNEKKNKNGKKKTTLQKVFISAMSWSKQVATVSILVK